MSISPSIDWLWMALDRFPTAEELIDRLIGKEHIVQFREDIKWILYNNSDQFANWRESNRNLQRQAHQGLIDAQRSRWDRLLVFIGIGGILTVAIPSISLFVAAASTVLTLSLVLRSATVGILAYENSYRERRNDRLKFMSAWNRGVMNSRIAYCILPIGLLGRVNQHLYRVALWRIESCYKNGK